MRALAGAALLLAGCAHEQVTLLPGEEGRSVGALAAINEDGSDRAVLASGNSRVNLRGGTGALGSVTVAPGRVDARYGALLADMPARAASYRLGFDFGEAALKPDEEALLGAIMSDARARPGAEVQVIGYTDTYDTPEVNDALSEQRAEAVRDYLVARGLPADIVRVSWRGERDPLVPTGDGVKEARNRRVEVVVR